MLLLGELNLDDETLAVGRLAVEVETGIAVLPGLSEMLAVADFEIDDVESEDGVERTDQQLFLAGLLENLSTGRVFSRSQSAISRGSCGARVRQTRSL